MKLHRQEAYNDVLKRVLVDLSELNEVTKREIEKAVREIDSGKYWSHAQVKTEIGL